MKKVEEKQTKTVNQKAVLHSIAMILAVITIVSIAIGLFAWSKYIVWILQNGILT